MKRQSGLHAIYRKVIRKSSRNVGVLGGINEPDSGS